MPVSGLEAVADAIMLYEGWRPGMPSYQHRNPGNLRWGKRQVGTAPDGFAIYNSLLDGYADLLDWLRAAASGENPHGLTAGSTLIGMMEVYAPSTDRNDPRIYARYIAAECSRALGEHVSEFDHIGNIFPMVSLPDAVQVAAVPKGRPSAG